MVGVPVTTPVHKAAVLGIYRRILRHATHLRQVVTLDSTSDIIDRAFVTGQFDKLQNDFQLILDIRNEIRRLFHRTIVRNDPKLLAVNEAKSEFAKHRSFLDPKRLKQLILEAVKWEETLRLSYIHGDPHVSTIKARLEEILVKGVQRTIESSLRRTMNRTIVQKNQREFLPNTVLSHELQPTLRQLSNVKWNRHYLSKQTIMNKEFNEQWSQLQRKGQSALFHSRLAVGELQNSKEVVQLGYSEYDSFYLSQVTLSKYLYKREKNVFMQKSERILNSGPFQIKMKYVKLGTNRLYYLWYPWKTSGPTSHFIGNAIEKKQNLIDAAAATSVNEFQDFAKEEAYWEYEMDNLIPKSKSGRRRKSREEYVSEWLNPYEVAAAESSNNLTQFSDRFKRWREILMMQKHVNQRYIDLFHVQQEQKLKKFQNTYSLLDVNSEEIPQPKAGRKKVKKILLSPHTDILGRRIPDILIQENIFRLNRSSPENVKKST